MRNREKISLIPNPSPKEKGVREVKIWS